MAAALYGVTIGIGFVVFTRLMPQPLGSLIYWSFFSVQLSWGAMTCWRRTGLPFATAAMVTGAAMSACLAVLAAMGHPFQALAPESWVLFVGGTVLGPLFLLIESRANRVKWQQWGRYMENKSFWDIVTGRHIPELRNRDD